jgi:Ni/Fe-hydrogenase subunit HybB-like protein
MATWGRHDPAWSPWTRFAAVVVYAAAMAHVEGVAVYYLRKLLHIVAWGPTTQAHFHFPHAYLRIEQSREVATIVMLVAVAYLAGHTPWQKLAYFLLAFGVWDVGHYVSLKVLLGWPPSLTTRDLLFLTPYEWWEPVWVPIAVSIGFIAVAVLIIRKTRKA